jgi:hypothetical protein
MEHCTVVPASGVNPKLGVGSSVGPAGPVSIVMVGKLVSTEKPRVCVVEFEAASVTRTLKVQVPSASVPAAWDVPVVHGPKAGVP